MPRGRRRTTLFISLIAGSALATSAAPAIAGHPDPSVRLIAPGSDVTTIKRYEGQPAYLDAGVLMAAVHGDFAIHAFRREFGGPVEVWQDLGSSMRPLPADVADGLDGIDRFFRVKLWDEDGDQVLHRKRDFCPGGEDVRITSAGPMRATYPRICWTNPFMLGTVWGIDRGWALSPFQWSAPSFDGPNGLYTMRVSIAPRYRDLFGVSQEAGVVTFDIRIKNGRGGCPECPFPGRLEGRGSSDRSAGRHVRGTLGTMPLVARPDPDTVPDLRAVPAYSISLSQRGGREQISFAATVWNAGAAPMIVEGFRRGDDPLMDAYQYFIRDGEAVGRARVGNLRYHRPHHHWHFLQFARYSLWDASMEEIYVSKKQAFCLVPTDAIDLTVDGADWRPWDDDLGTACGSYDPDAVWMRESLQSGWGDTYYQGGGTSLDVTGVPNGIYYVAVEANPDGLLYETDKTNNVELRKIRLGGTPGHRTLKVFDFNGIDA